MVLTKNLPYKQRPLASAKTLAFPFQTITHHELPISALPRSTLAITFRIGSEEVLRQCGGFNGLCAKKPHLEHTL
ncbi:unnamed protein product [Linum trigynum]|uniref:Uncharacterized protein n=1 Tax=Linum trigynum TaxID=586398 RepID=A0AAV2E898_9ROSI